LKSTFIFILNTYKNNSFVTIYSTNTKICYGILCRRHV